ncbi:hypothetical protein Bbelb_146430 [Branchiostoma belcheri]|nr:hypothetical protein Bbelb_146430 [Branchiostoma belcheri]
MSPKIRQTLPPNHPAALGTSVPNRLLKVLKRVDGRRQRLPNYHSSTLGRLQITRHGWWRYITAPLPPMSFRVAGALASSYIAGLGTAVSGSPAFYLQDRPDEVFGLPPESQSDVSARHKVYIRQQPATVPPRTACIMPGRICKQYPILCERLGLFSQRGRSSLKVTQHVPGGQLCTNVWKICGLIKHRAESDMTGTFRNMDGTQHIGPSSHLPTPHQSSGTDYTFNGHSNRHYLQ